MPLFLLVPSNFWDLILHSPQQLSGGHGPPRPPPLSPSLWLLAFRNALWPAAPRLPHSSTRRPKTLSSETNPLFTQRQTRKILWILQTHPHLPSYLSWKAVPDSKMFFWASKLKTDQKAHSVRDSQGSGDRSWTEPNSQLQITVDGPLATTNLKAQGRKLTGRREG